MHRDPLRSLLILAAFALADLALASEPVDEVIVTASRMRAPLQTHAGSISVLTSEDIERLGATHHSELLNRAPGTLIQRNSGQESLTAIRSPVLSGPGSCGVFLFLENSVPIRPIGFCNVNELFEVNSEQARAVEVLRGPAGVVYGSGAMHGAVNVLLAGPEDLPATGVSFEVGPDAFYRGELRARHQAGEHAFGGAVMATDDGGWRASSGLQEQKITLSWRQAPAAGQATSVYLSGSNLNQETAGFIQGENAYRSSSLARANPNPEAYRDAYALRVMGEIERTLSPSLQLTLRPYARRSRMDFLQHFLIGKPREENGQDSVGVLTSLAITLGPQTTVLTGVELEHAQGFLREIQAGPSTDGAPAANAIRPAGRHYDYEVSSLVGALYAQVEQRLSDAVRLSGGVRGERVEYDYDNRMIAGNTREDGTTCTPAGCLYARPADRKDVFTNTTARLTASYDLSPQATFYAAATRGYRAPDTSELYRLQRQQSIADLDAERLDSAELGARGSWGALRYTLAAFVMAKDNVIFRDASGFNVSNGRTDHEGVEYELQLDLHQTIGLHLGGTYARHTYEFNAMEGAELILAGRDVDTAPRHLHSARLHWRPLVSTDAELEWQSVGRYFVDASNQHDYPGHDVLNLRVSWRPAERWRTTLRVNNLTDRAYADRADYAFGSYRYFPGRDRSAFLEVAFDHR